MHAVMRALPFALGILFTAVALRAQPGERPPIFAPKPTVTQPEVTPARPELVIKFNQLPVAFTEEQGGARTFELDVTAKLKRFLIDRGTSLEYGARELKRTIQKFILQPLAGVINSGRIPPGSLVEMELKIGEKILIRIHTDEADDEG